MTGLHDVDVSIQSVNDLVTSGVQMQRKPRAMPHTSCHPSWVLQRVPYPHCIDNIRLIRNLLLASLSLAFLHAVWTAKF